MADRYLEGKKAWVTGGVSGQGRATALMLAQAGVDVAIGSLFSAGAKAKPEDEDTYYPADADMRTVCEEIESHGVKSFGQEFDVRSPDSVQSFHDNAEAAFGQIDILVNAAGTWAEHSLIGHPDELWHSVIDTNLNGVYYTTRTCLPGMVERQWGRIVNISSSLATAAFENTAAYAASKAGILGFTKVTALEGAPHVTCNAISPGTVDTGFTHVMLDHWMERDKAKGEARSPEEYLAEIASYNPQNRLIKAEEIANLAVFLCREESYGISSENILVAAGSHI